ncbi:MAG: hypothetical protein ACP5N1_04240 [Candidatus Woesearchaeota archaeon]
MTITDIVRKNNHLLDIYHSKNLIPLGDDLNYSNEDTNLTIDKNQVVSLEHLWQLPSKKVNEDSSAINIRRAQIRGTGDEISILCISDPLNKLDSVEYAKALNSNDWIKGNPVKIIDISNNYQFIDSIWSQKAIDAIYSNLSSQEKLNLADVTIVFAGFEKLSDEQLFNHFRCPNFESKFESFQEHKQSIFNGTNYNVSLVVTGKAYSAFLAEKSTYIAGTGDINNFVQRVQKSELYLVANENNK